MTERLPLFSRALLLGLLFATAGCFRATRGPCDTPPPLHVELTAAPLVNLDEQGQALTTTVQLLQLKGKLALEKLELGDLLSSPKAALAEDFLKLDELTVDPGKTVKVWVPRDPKAAYVAAVGIVRKPTGTSWREVMPLPQVLTKQCLPEQPERKGDPAQEDTRIQLFLKEYQVSGILQPRPEARAPGTRVAQNGTP